MRHPNIAPCHCRTSQGATRQLRTLRLSHAAPCDTALSHPATYTCRTMRLENLAFELQNPALRIIAPPFRSCIEPVLDIRFVESVRMVFACVAPCPAAGEGDCLLVHANVLFLTEARPIPDTPRTLASTSPSGSVSAKIVKNKSQGATPGHCTLRLPNFARCDATTSHLAKPSCRTLRSHDITPCNFLVSHPATQKHRFRPQNHAQPAAFSSLDKSNIPDILAKI